MIDGEMTYSEAQLRWRMVKAESRALDGAGSVLSGKGEYGAANIVWGLAERARQRALQLRQQSEDWVRPPKRST